MKAKIEQFPEKNPNPVFHVEKDGTILYSNEAGKPLLSEWSVGIGEKVPLEIRDLVRRIYSQKSSERMKINAGNRVYILAFYPSSEEEYVDIYGFYIGDQKTFEGKLRESEAREIGKLELGKIIDTQAIQSLMNDFNKLVRIPMGLTDLKGNVLVSAGWQDICTKFHRVHPKACKHCVESDINLSMGVALGEYKLYKCKNNMWDIVTPIIVEGQHVGNILSGQFFFNDEPLDYELFRSQARKYGFNEEEYIKAVEKVPRLSREAVNAGMGFFMIFANMISQLSYSNIKLSQSLAEHDAVVDALRESERSERARSDELAVLLDAVPVSVYIAHDPQALRITGNRLSYEWLQLPMGTNISKSAPEGERPEIFKLLKNGVEIPLEYMPSQMAAAGREINDCELDIVSADGKIRHVLGNARPLRDEKGNLRGSISAFIDITEREQAEEALLKSEERYRMLFTNMTEGFCLVEVIYNNYGKPYDYRYLEINPAFELHFGVKRDDLLGKTMLETFPNVSQIAIEKYGEVALTGQPTHFETFSSIANKYLDIYTFSPEKGKLGIVLRDITESKQAEEALIQAYEEIRIKSEELQAQAEELQEANKALMISENEFRALAENSPDVIARFDKQNRHLYANPAAAKVYGYSQEEIIGKTHSELGRDPEQINFWETHHQKVFDTGQPETMEFKFKSPNGKIILL